MPELEKVVLVFFGWLLGLLGPIVVDQIRRARDVNDVSKAIDRELCELRYRLALAVFLIQDRFGRTNHSLLEWLKHVLEKYDGLNKKDSILVLIQQRMKPENSQIPAILRAEAEQKKRTLQLKKYDLPLLDSRLQTLSMMTPERQGLLLEIRNQLSLANQEVDMAQEYFEMTFKDLESGNYDRVCDNLEKCCEQYVLHARVIIGHIDKLVD